MDKRVFIKVVGKYIVDVVYGGYSPALEGNGYIPFIGEGEVPTNIMSGYYMLIDGEVVLDEVKLFNDFKIAKALQATQCSCTPIHLNLSPVMDKLSDVQEGIAALFEIQAQSEEGKQEIIEK